jgi:hypothetical protein
MNAELAWLRDQPSVELPPPIAFAAAKAAFAILYAAFAWINEEFATTEGVFANIAVVFSAANAELTEMKQKLDHFSSQLVQTYDTSKEICGPLLFYASLRDSSFILAIRTLCEGRKRWNTSLKSCVEITSHKMIIKVPNSTNMPISFHDFCCVRKRKMSASKIGKINHLEESPHMS